MMDNLTTIVMVVVPAVGAIAWLMTLHGRVGAHDRELRDIKDDIRYIRDRIDRALLTQ